MNEKEREGMKKVFKDVEKRIGKKELAKMQDMIHKLGIMTAIRNLNGSKDYDEIAQELFKIKDGIISIKSFKDIVKEEYPELVKEKMINKDGSLSPEAIRAVLHYDVMLYENEFTEDEQVKRNVQEWKKGSIIETIDGMSFRDIRINRGDKAVIVHGESFTMYDDEGKQEKAILVIWEKDAKHTPRTMWLSYGNIVGETDKYKGEDYSEKFNDLKDGYEVTFKKIQSLLTFDLSKEEKNIIDKRCIETSGAYKMTKEETKEFEKLKVKLEKIGIVDESDGRDKP